MPIFYAHVFVRSLVNGERARESAMKTFIPQHFRGYPTREGEDESRGARAKRSRLAKAAEREEIADGERRRRRKRGAHTRVFAERRLQTGRTGLRGQFIANKWVTLVRRRISPEFIVYYSAGPRDDIGPCLLVVALMSLIAPPVRNRIAASHRVTGAGKP